GLIERLVRIRAWTLDARVTRVTRDPECPACAKGSREFLTGRDGGDATVLCGRGAVQVRPARPPQSFDLAALALRLRPLGEVEERAFLLRYRDPEVSFTLFPDGRMIVEN